MIHLGIIGGGAVVQTHHWPALCDLADQIRPVALARRDQKQAERFARRAGIERVYGDYKELLQDDRVDAVLTSVPIDLNGPLLLEAVQAGKHVLAEKPIAATPIEARRVLNESATHKEVLLVGENYRYRQDLNEAKSLIGAGAIGSVYGFQLAVKFELTAKARARWISKGWRREARHPGGFILDAGVHPVAALRLVLGEVTEVFAKVLWTSQITNGPDSLLMQVQMRDGTVGQCFFCYTAKERRENPMDFSIYGTSGVMRISNGRVAVSRGIGHRVTVSRIDDGKGAYARQWSNFCAAIRGEEAVLSTAVEAYRDLLVIDAALQSSATGDAVRIPC